MLLGAVCRSERFCGMYGIAALRSSDALAAARLRSDEKRAGLRRAAATHGRAHLVRRQRSEAVAVGGRVLRVLQQRPRPRAVVAALVASVGPRGPSGLRGLRELARRRAARGRRAYS